MAHTGGFTVYPEALNPVNADNPQEGIKQLEGYIRYMCERSDFAVATMGGVGSGADVERRFEVIEGRIAAENSRITMLERRRQLPDVTAEDAGKFLVVNTSGEWAATRIPLANQNSF